MKYKDARLEKEYALLHKHNLKLRDLLIMLDGYSRAKYGKEITITHLYRTKEEHQALYAKTPESQRPKSSPHETWNAVDLRSSTFTKAEQDDLCALLNKTYKNANAKPIAFVHKIPGNVDHFHIQVL